jgi:hypothetical protein
MIAGLVWREQRMALLGSGILVVFVSFFVEFLVSRRSTRRRTVDRDEVIQLGELVSSSGALVVTDDYDATKRSTLLPVGKGAFRVSCLVRRYTNGDIVPLRIELVRDGDVGNLANSVAAEIVVDSGALVIGDADWLKSKNARPIVQRSIKQIWAEDSAKSWEMVRGEEPDNRACVVLPSTGDGTYACQWRVDVGAIISIDLYDDEIEATHLPSPPPAPNS